MPINGEEGYMAINGGRKLEWRWGREISGGAGGLLFCVIIYICDKGFFFFF